VELRHIAGLLFDDDRVQVPLEEELSIFQQVLDKVRLDLKILDEKRFTLRLIITGLKIIGRSHVLKMIDTVVDGRSYSNLIAGFDMVNHEDVTPPILNFVPEILDGQSRDAKSLPCFFHCGETHDRFNENLFDAVLLGSKRLGHGFQLFLHPSLQQEVKERGICIEVCPVSNLLLGYTIDLRCHPVRFMLHKGLQASISSDDPGFFGYEGVTMDYLMAYIAWDLNIRDIKKLSLNGIEYANIDTEHKTYLKDEIFSKEWKEFVQNIIAKYGGQ
jgi:adenosine deaminase CECR1